MNEVVWVSAAGQLILMVMVAAVLVFETNTSGALWQNSVAMRNRIQCWCCAHEEINRRWREWQNSLKPKQ
jgi:hypothetical protein